MYKIERVRYFRNEREMVGFVAEIHRDGVKLGQARHDGDAVFYTVDIRDVDAHREFIKWAEEIAPQTMWNPAEFNDHGIESNRIGLLETAGVEYLLTKYEVMA